MPEIELKNIEKIKLEKPVLKVKKEDLEKEVDELKQLLSEANSRSDEKDLLVFELEEKVEKLTAEIEEKNIGMYILHYNHNTIST